MKKPVRLLAFALVLLTSVLPVSVFASEDGALSLALSCEKASEVAGEYTLEYLSGFATGHVDLHLAFLTYVRVVIRLARIRFHCFDSCHLEADGGSHIGVYARVARLEVTVRANSHIPVVLGLRVDVLLFRDDHVGHFIVPFDIILAGRDVDVHAERQVDVPAVGYEVLHLQASNVDDAVVVEAVDVQIGIQVTRGDTASVGKADGSLGVGVSRQEVIRGVLVVEPVMSQCQRYLPLTLLRSKHYTLFLAL